MDISNEDEKCLQLVLEEILDKIKIDNKEFQKTFDHYVSNSENHEQINAAKEDAEIDR